MEAYGLPSMYLSKGIQKTHHAFKNIKYQTTSHISSFVVIFMGTEMFWITPSLALVLQTNRKDIF